MTDSHEQYILLRLAKGDKEAFAAVFDKYYGKVYTFVRSMVRQRAVAEDITQDLFVKLWEKRRRLSRISSGILTNVAFPQADAELIEGVGVRAEYLGRKSVPSVL